MSDLMEWVKLNVREGANIAEAEEMISRIDVNQAITNKEQALDFIKKNDYFNGALDSETSKRIDKFSNETLPTKIEAERARLRDELSAELNPKETPEQKRIRELEQIVKDGQRKDQESQLKAQLRAKAKELNYDADKAERYSRFGEDAFKYLEGDVQDYSTYVNSQIDTKIKEKFGNDTPKRSISNDPSKVMSRPDFDNLNPQSKMTFIQSGGILEE